MMKSFLFALCCLCVFNAAYGQDRPALDPVLEKRAMKVVQQLINTSFPQLKGVSITPKSILNPSVFLATDIEIPSLFSAQRQYVLYLNHRLLENPMDDQAFEAIMAHELVHFSDYEKMNVAELAVFYLQILAGGEYEANYERATDLQTMEKGFALGLKSFRYWLYEQISAEAKILKEKNYYTPAQIDDWLLDQQEVSLL